MNRIASTLVAFVVLTLAATAWVQAQEGTPRLGTPGLLSETYWNDVPALTEIATHDGVREGVNSFGKLCLEEASLLEQTGKKVLDAAGKPGLSGAMREKGLQLYAQGQRAEQMNRAAADWAKKLGKALDRINIVNTIATSLGHAVEGDLPGAVAVVVDEAAKKATTTGMAAAGSVGGPLGSFAGAMAGEELHDAYTRPAIEKKADEWRQAEANERLLGSEARTPPHKREAALKEERRLKEQLEDAEGEVRPGREEGEAPKDDVDILSVVSPIRLQATGRTEENVSADKIRNVVTSTFALSFYNVGSLAPGYGKAVLVIRSTASLNNTQDSNTCQGLFSGGPDGSFRMICDRSVVQMRLINGQQVVAPEGARLTVDNPAAFKGWPVKK